MESKYQAFLLILASVLLLLIIYLNFPLKPKTLGRTTGFTNSQWTLIATGDVMLGRTIMTTSQDKNDYLYPFRKVADKLKESDITFVNLENPVIENCPRKVTGMVFCSDPKMLDGLTYAGIDIVSLANNHTLNYGKTGLTETQELLTDKNIGYTNGNLLIKEIKGVKVGFIGLMLVDKKNLTNEEMNLLKESNLKVDLLIVAPHWGYEYQATGSKYQKQMANEIVQNGGDLIIGNHPHWVQNVENIEGKKVYYSLGNFVFDQMWSEETRKGLAVKFTFNGNELIKEEQMPVYINNWAQPEWR